MLGLAENRGKTISELESAKSGLENLVQVLEAKIREHESMRRTFHNTIQELKGNIRVFCRMRPLLENEKDCGSETGVSQIKFPENEEGNHETRGLIFSKELLSWFNLVILPQESNYQSRTILLLIKCFNLLPIKPLFLTRFLSWSNQLLMDTMFVFSHMVKQEVEKLLRKLFFY